MASGQESAESLGNPRRMCGYGSIRFSSLSRPLVRLGPLGLGRVGAAWGETKAVPDRGGPVEWQHSVRLRRCGLVPWPSVIRPVFPSGVDLDLLVSR
jgi:hypothetical protein